MLRVFRCLLWVAAIASGLAQAAEVQGVRLWTEADGSTRVVLDLAAAAGQHSVFLLEGPSRVVVDLEQSRLGGSVSLPGGAGVVSGIRSGSQGSSGLRIVLDLRDNQAVHVRSFSLPPDGGYGHRLVIDLVPAGHSPTQVNSIAQTAASVGRDLIIVIDPGHGGRDPGAVGYSGVYEKDVVLAISLELARQIDSEPGMRAILTREGDYFVELRDRMEYARAAQADLFISVHADACCHDAINRTVRGATVYVLSERGASDEAALRLAERENQAHALYGTSLVGFDDEVASVLMDLMQSATRAVSFIVSERIIGQMARVTNVRRADVLQAPFLVLKSPDVPSLLLEMGYMTSPEDERALADPVHQRRLAEAIFVGIREYFYENPKPGTYIAERGQEGTGLDESLQYVVTAGDTLSGIAQRYGVSVQALRSSNGLHSDVIHAGQRLTIPGQNPGGLASSTR